MASQMGRFFLEEVWKIFNYEDKSSLNQPWNLQIEAESFIIVGLTIKVVLGGGGALNIIPINKSVINSLYHTRVPALNTLNNISAMGESIVDRDGFGLN